jgi:hypothetical protein
VIRATYDPEARAVAIVLAADERHTVVHEVVDGMYVGLRDGMPVMLELIGMGGTDDEHRLEAAAGEYGLDAAAVLTAFRAAVGVPGREVTVDVAAPRAA